MSINLHVVSTPVHYTLQSETPLLCLCEKKQKIVFNYHQLFLLCLCRGTAYLDGRVCLFARPQTHPKNHNVDLLCTLPEAWLDFHLSCFPTMGPMATSATAVLHCCARANTSAADTSGIGCVLRGGCKDWTSPSCKGRRCGVCLCQL